MRVAILGLGSVILAVTLVAAVTLRQEATMWVSADCDIPDCGDPQGPEGMIMFALVAILAVLMAVAEARRR
jgi:hypothetical protein